jgi:crotonobetainyl-CoA:carnitine CoA-transferase CaiB-like acyl-CoA transferase
VAHREELLAELTERLRERGADEWFETLTAVGVPCGPINDLGEAFAFAERLGLDPRVHIDDPNREAPAAQVANPIRLSAAPAAYVTAPPRLGEHTEQILAELGLSAVDEAGDVSAAP